MLKILNAQDFRDQIIDLLGSEQLPVADLPGELENFIVAVENEHVIGVGGLEIHGSCGLFRSLAVRSDKRGQGIAGTLISRLEAEGIKKGITAFYLLTETAEKYFEKKSYVKIERVAVPDEIKGSAEFSHICPSTAIVMKKDLK